jgi:hypothetical protein
VFLCVLHPSDARNADVHSPPLSPLYLGPPHHPSFHSLSLHCDHGVFVFRASETLPGPSPVGASASGAGATAATAGPSRCGGTHAGGSRSTTPKAGDPIPIPSHVLQPIWKPSADDLAVGPAHLHWMSSTPTAAKVKFVDWKEGAWPSGWPGALPPHPPPRTRPLTHTHASGLLVADAEEVIPVRADHAVPPWRGPLALGAPPRRDQHTPQPHQPPGQRQQLQCSAAGLWARRIGGGPCQ